MRTSKAILFCAAAVLLAAGLRAGAREDFAAANRAYEQGRYAEALPLYLQAARLARDWQVPYNIGNCYYKLERYLSAKVYYLKAQKFRPLDAAIARNIAMTNQHFPDAVAPAQPDFIQRAAQRLAAMLSLDALSILLLLALAAANACLFLLLTRGRNKKTLSALAFSLLMASGLWAFHLSRTAALARSDSAVVWAEGSQLRSGPGEDNTVLFEVGPGLDVRIIDRSGDWVQAAASEHIAGWIEIKRLVLI